MSNNNKKVERVYNKDRIQRIKQASEFLKQQDPNWHNDAPPSILPDEDDDMPITQMRTPPFLKEQEPDIIESDGYSASKKLTLNELTQCNKDSSQVQGIIQSNKTSFGKPMNNNVKSINYLEMSRMKKVKERDDLNRQTAESLDKASEKWHYQLKEFKNRNTQDSTGVKSSLFGEDENNEFEKAENERNEKNGGKYRFSSDFVNRLDLLLQRGMRTSNMGGNNMNFLRRINERSFNRWSNRFDRHSSMLDLRYPLLNNSMNGMFRSNHFTPGIGFSKFKSESKLVSNRNFLNSINGSRSFEFQYPDAMFVSLSNLNSPASFPQNQAYNSNLNPSINFPQNPAFNSNVNSPTNFPQNPNFNSNVNSPTNFPLNNPYNSNLGYSQNVNKQCFSPYPQKANPDHLPMTNINQFPPNYDVQSNMNVNQFPPNNTAWQNHFIQQPFQPHYPSNITAQPQYFQEPYMPPPSNPANNQDHSQNPVATINTKAANLDMNNTFESVTRKIDILTEKLDMLHLTVDELKTVQSRQGIKSIIKTHKNVNIASDSEKSSENPPKPNETSNQRPLSKTCNCPDCFNKKSQGQHNATERRVRFELEEEDVRERNRNKDRVIVYERPIESEDGVFESKRDEKEESYPIYPKAVHPNYIYNQFHNRSRTLSQFQTFQLPSELSPIMQSNFKRSSQS